MPSGGLLQLVAYGAQNVLLSGNPDFTFFYKVYKKYTHFALETRSKLMDGPTDYPFDKTTQLRARVDRVGDLATDMYFSFQVPAIFSKYQTINPTTGPTTQQEFQWVRYLGAAAIQSVYITVGPNKVQEFTGEYLMARALIDYPKDKFEKWQELVGDVPLLNNPANGPFGTPTATGGQYPTVFQDSRFTGAQQNTPSIPAYTVYVPLPFWFTEESQALPLVGLQYYTVDVTINMTPSQQLYTTLDPSGYRMASGYRILSSQLDIQSNTPELVNTSDTATQIRNFFVDIGYTTPPLNTWPMSPTLHTTYGFLPEEERTIFATTPLTYIVRQVVPVVFPEILGNQLLRLDVTNPISRLILCPRRSDILLYRNGWANFTNWWNWPQRPKIPNQVSPDIPFYECESATGLLVPAGQKDIIQALRVLADGNEIQEVKPTSFFTRITPWRYLDGGAGRDIPVYTFELHSPTAQPAGSLNASRISRLQIDLQVYPLPQMSTYFYGLTVYVESLNFFLVESGVGDVKYST